MFELFTEPVKQVFVLSVDEAVQLNRNRVGTEHVLLGLLRLREGIAADVLASLRIDYETALADVVRTSGRRRWRFRSHTPFSKETKKSLEQSLHESVQARHNFIDTEHVLLGLLHERHGPAAPLLRNLGAPPELVREQVNRVWADRSRFVRE